MATPKIQNSINLLIPAMILKVQAILRDLEGHGLDPILYESLRSQARQKWLYSSGRTRKGPVVTYDDGVIRKSKHQLGRAADIISKKHGWSDTTFFDALESSAHAHGLHTLDWDRAHVELDSL